MLRELLNWFTPPADDPGAWAERQAAQWLQEQRGFRIVARNWRSPRDRRYELDLVCQDGPVLVFVEVKARREGALVQGYHAVNLRKKRALLQAAKAYLARLDPKPQTFRLDIVEVELRRAGGTPEIRHFENIPLFSKHYRG